ncbi:unnamed protein product [Nezara viridula]|uniref:F-box domain-containing protein n=1 Tax=Nezara viridula TaxID=85310 RepID=A0A9P0HEX9_NEZVI|nr:unnamed protein product [Nezara viridula]
MSSHGLVSSFEKLEMFVGEDSNENHGTQSDASSSTRDTLKALTYNADHGPYFIDDADKAYIILLNVFRYLSIKDLQAAMQVCKVWNLVGSDKIFWKRISLNNCIVHDTDMMVRTLKKCGTERLDLRGMSSFKMVRLLPSDDNWSSLLKGLINTIEMPDKWLSLCEALTKVTTLTEVTIEECSAHAVNLLAKGAPQLKSLVAYRIIKGLDMGMGYMDITFLKDMRCLKKLRLENAVSRELSFDKTSDKIELNLTSLAITRAVNLSCIEHILPPTLVSLELGECHSLSFNFPKDVLPKLVNLTRLRLELCNNTYLVIMLVEAISKLPNLAELELINFEISTGFGKVIAKCINLKSLLIIPLYGKIPKHLHPLMNSLIVSGVSKLKNSLQVFVWVVTDSMLSVENARSLRIGQNPVKVRVIGRGDVIPLISNNGAGFRIDFISLDNVQALLLQDLKFKVFKTPFSSTWKLSLHNIRM